MSTDVVQILTAPAQVVAVHGAPPVSIVTPAPSGLVGVEEDPAQINVTGGAVATIGVAAPIPGDGPPGPPGPPGPAGPPGAPGTGGGTDFRYTHYQPVPASVWTIVHGLGGYPTVTPVDSTERTVEGGEIHYLDANTLTVSFSGAFAGLAHLS